eukprot:scaffold1449_cov108-Isochrysis_galbana.AAC.8
MMYMDIPGYFDQVLVNDDLEVGSGACMPFYQPVRRDEGGMFTCGCQHPQACGTHPAPVWGGVGLVATARALRHGERRRDGA